MVRLPKILSLLDLSLFNNGLVGTIPALGGLTALRQLYLFTNGLTGTIPRLSGLTALQRLDLSSNGLTGTIPALGGLTAPDRTIAHPGVGGLILRVPPGAAPLSRAPLVSDMVEGNSSSRALRPLAPML